MTNEELRQLAMKATPGPWWVDRSPEADGQDAFIAYGDPSDRTAQYDLLERYNVDTDYAYIAAVDPQTVLRLLDRIDELELNR